MGIIARLVTKQCNTHQLDGHFLRMALLIHKNSATYSRSGYTYSQIWMRCSQIKEECVHIMGILVQKC